MFRTRRTLHVMLRRSLGLFALVAVAVLMLLAGGNAVWAWNDIDRAAVSLQATVPIPGTAANTTGGKLYVFDISWVDQGSQLYYLADRSNAVVDIVDATTNTLLDQLPGGFRGFTGNNGSSGPQRSYDCRAMPVRDRCAEPSGFVQRIDFPSDNGQRRRNRIRRPEPSRRGGI